MPSSRSRRRALSSSPIWAFAGGFLEIIAAFGSDETPGSRAMLVIGGMLSVIFGDLAFRSAVATRPFRGMD